MQEGITSLRDKLVAGNDSTLYTCVSTSCKNSTTAPYILVSPLAVKTTPYILVSPLAVKTAPYILVSPLAVKTTPYILVSPLAVKESSQPQ
jgi:predicted N-acetyltransferase YhbS